MAIVIDASVAIAWCLRDRPGTLVADATIEQGGLEGIVVPDLSGTKCGARSWSANARDASKPAP